MADKIYPAIMPNTKAYDLGDGTFSPIHPNIYRGLHHRVIWFGRRNPQTDTLWADPATLLPYVAISGDNAWGADPNDEAFLFGPGDAAIHGTPHGYAACKPDEVLFVANTSQTVSRLRLIWGTGTMAAAIAAGQYSDLMFANLVVGAVIYAIYDIATPVIPFYVGGVAMRAWVQHWNATDNATVSFFIGMTGFFRED